MSYGPNSADLYRRAATYVDKILNGTSPPTCCGAADEVRADHQSNSRQVLGLTIPQSVLGERMR